MKTRFILVGMFSLILAGMVWVTTTASLDRSVLLAAGDLWNDPWGRATLFDAYFGFLVIYVWIFFRETGWMVRAIWLLLLLSLGNLAIATYFLWALLRAPGGDWRSIFPRAEELSR